jgi:ABC-type phosphate/phosphonate transport system substrate-binding protein
MATDAIAALPMYDFPQLQDATDAFWAAVARRLTAAGLDGVPHDLTRDLGHRQVWGHPALLLAQACEYPLAKSFANRVKLVATPRYSAPGCEGSHYRSAIIVRADDPSQSLGELRGRRCAVNEVDSNSGMNLLRAAVAPLARATRFFAAVKLSGSHLHSVRMVTAGEADIAAIDCVTLEHLRRLEPVVVGGIRVLCWTETAPSLPFITARSNSPATLHALRRALTEVFADDTLTSVRARLLLRGVDVNPVEGFGAVLRLERAAIQQGYGTIDGLQP